MSDFNVSYDAMESSAMKLDGGKDDIVGVLEDCKGEVQALTEDGFKTNNASEAFYDDYDSLTTNLRDASENISDMATTLRKLADHIRNEDQTMYG